MDAKDVFSYLGHENPTRNIVLDFLTGIACLVRTSGAKILDFLENCGMRNIPLTICVILLSVFLM